MAQHPSLADPAPASPPSAPALIDPVALARWRRHVDSVGDAPAAQPWLHGEVARRMAERLPLIRKQPQTVLDWWAGASASQALLAGQYPKTRRIAVDTAGRVQAPERGAGGWWRRLAGPAAPPADRTPPPSDLLWANMMLHWVDDLPGLLARWHAATAVDGFLMFSCFGPDTLRELHAIYQQAGYGPAGPRHADMHDIGDALVHAGFADPVMDMEQLTLTWDTPEALLAELRSLGRNVHAGRHPALRTPRWRDTLLERLDAGLRQPDGRLHLSFEIVYGHAFRAPAKARVTARTEISLDAMREMTRRRNTESP